ncbi:MAG: oligosaccharide flippase family protein [Ectobacillus sp.]
MEIRKHSMFWRGAIILTLSGLIMKVLSAFYRIPYQNIAGDIGFYIYQQVYPLYGISLVLATYGFPVVISKLVASRFEKGDQRGVEGVIFVSFWFLMIGGACLFLIIFLGADYIGFLMGDRKLGILLKVVAFSFLFMPFLSTARGYFQGIGNMTPTAVSQVAEQSVRVGVIIVLSLILVSAGFDIYIVGAGAMFGSAAGAAIGVAILVYFLRKDIKRIFSRGREDIPDKALIVKLVFWQGIAICISNLSLILIQLIDSVSLYKLLVMTGLTGHEAKVLKGVYDRGMPLIQLGTVAATAFSLPLIPLITGARTRGDKAFIQEKVQLAMKITLIIGLAASAGLICIIRPTNIMLFQNNSGSNILALLAVSILFSAFSITSASILQGLGNTTLPAFFTFIGAAVKYAGNILLVPGMGAKGAAIATVSALFSIAALNTIAVMRRVHHPIVSWSIAGRIVFSCFGMVLIVIIYTYIFENIFPVFYVHHRAVASLEALTAVTIGGIAYIFLIFKLRVFTNEELGAVWKGGKIPLIFRR